MAALTRSEFLKGVGAGAILGVAPMPAGALAPKNQPSSGVDHAAFSAAVAKIRADIGGIEFPHRDFRLEDFGGKGDGVADCTKAFKAAIAACSKSGGGRVVLGEGVYRTGPVVLLSGVNLHIPFGARLKFIPEPERYLPPVMTRWEGVEMMGYSPLLYALDQTNIAVTGGGLIDGGADWANWWPWKGEWKGLFKNIPEEKTQRADRERLFAYGESGAPVSERVFGAGNLLRPPLVQFYRCKKVLIEGVTLAESPFWLLNPVLCEDVIIRNVTSRSFGPNNDGLNPESCRNVLIENCTFDTGDDCIAIKAGRNADGRRLAAPCENIVIAGCVMSAGHGGVSIGSEMSGGVRNVFVEDCVMSSPDLIRMLNIKTNAERGGFVESVWMRNIEVGEVLGAVVRIDFNFEEGAVGAHLPKVRDIAVDSIAIREAGRLVVLRGFDNAPIENFVLSNVDCSRQKFGSFVDHVKGFAAHNVKIDGKRVAASRISDESVRPWFESCTSLWASCDCPDAACE